jgi:hypothetical protein
MVAMDAAEKEISMLTAQDKPRRKPHRDRGVRKRTNEIFSRFDLIPSAEDYCVAGRMRAELRALPPERGQHRSLIAACFGLDFSEPCWAAAVAS